MGQPHYKCNTLSFTSSKLIFRKNFKLRSDPQVSISDSPLAMSRFKSTIDTPKVSDASPTREIQTNQIEDFIRRSSRNFRQFLSLQSDGDVRSPL